MSSERPRWIIAGVLLLAAFTLGSCVDIALIAYTEALDTTSNYTPDQIELLESELDRQLAIAEVTENPTTLFTNHGVLDATDPARIEIPISGRDYARRGKPEK